MSNTPNLNLIRPNPNDFYNIADFNTNADRIDAAFPVSIARGGTGQVTANAARGALGAEPFRQIVTPEEAEAGISTSVRSWIPLRVRQAANAAINATIGSVRPSESGTFTPVLAQGNIIWATNARGRYRREGNLCHFDIHIRVNQNRSGSSGELEIRGLPFIVENNHISLHERINHSPGVTPFPDSVRYWLVLPNRTNLTAAGARWAYFISEITPGAITSGMEMYISGIYKIRG